MAKKTQEDSGGGSVGTATAKKAKGKTEKVLREGVQNLKEFYESEGWVFTETDTIWVWQAFNPSPVFPNLKDEKITQIFKFIEAEKDANNGLIRNFIENDRAKFDAGRLPLAWETQKIALEELGYEFDYDVEKSQWSGTSEKYLGVANDNNFGMMARILTKNVKNYYEKEGWTFIESNDAGSSTWVARNGSPIFPVIERDSLTDIFRLIEKLKAENGEKFDKFIEKNFAPSEDKKSEWALPLIQQIEINEFIEKHDATTLYLTENSTVEIEYTDKKKGVSTAVFVDVSGSRHNKRKPEFGANISDSILSVENFYEKFPHFAPKVANDDLATKVAEEKSSVGGEIALSEIVPSPFEGQKRRRMRFTDEEISELAASVTAHGVLQPIVVREVGGKYEIIAGERRFLAASQAGLETVPAVVKNVSDEVAFEMQTIENLQRKDPDPIDEAFSYSEYIEKYGRTVDDLAVKFGKPVKFIRARLRLKKLIPEVLADIAAGHLPLGHAAEISKLAPETQKQALDLCYDTNYQNGEWQPDKTEIRTLADFLSEVDEEIFLSLKSARFSLTATNLRPDGLACVNCPERTGAAESLFAEMHDAKDDRCLNAACFKLKTARRVQIVRDEKSAERIAAGDAEAGYKMPIIVWAKNARIEIERIFNERPLADGEYVPITNNTGECDSMEFGIFVDDNAKFGIVTKFCRVSDCPKHQKMLFNSASSASGSAVKTEKTDEEKSGFYKRKQEIFDIKVGEAVRNQTLSEAAKTLSATRWIFDDEKWRVRLVARLWNRTDDNAHRVVETALGREKYSISPGWYESEAVKYFNKNFNFDELSRMLFLLIVGNESEMLWGSWKDQTEVREIAEQFGVDYALLDAKERVEAAPKKFADAAKEHLGKIERGEKAARPVFYKLEK